MFLLKQFESKTSSYFISNIANYNSVASRGADLEWTQGGTDSNEPFKLRTLGIYYQILRQYLHHSMSCTLY